MKQFSMIFISCFLWAACNKNHGDPTPKQPAHGIPVAKGTPLGVPANKVIGTLGGSLNAPDNKLTVIIPPGAVSENTQFSIQQITNTAPNGIANSYLLLPEGKHFLKPLTIQFHYMTEDLEGTYPEALIASYQDNEGIWHAKNNTQIDADNKTVSVTTDHFSRWAVFASTRLIVDKPSINTNESAELSVKEVSKDILSSLSSGEAALDTVETKNEVSNWQLTGEGILSSFQKSATYFAPATKPATNPVMVSVKVSNASDGNSSTRTITLQRKIYVNSSFLEIVLNGNTNIYPFAEATLNLGVVSIYGNNAQGNGGRFNLQSGGGTGAWNWGNPLAAGTDVTLTIGGLTFNDLYKDCASNSFKFTTGTVQIAEWGEVGGYVAGSFEGDVVNQQSQSCLYTIKHITGRFRAKRKL